MSEIYTSQEVYLVVENIDLGYHVVAIYTSKERAEEALEKANEIAHKQKREALGKIEYMTEKDVDNWMKSYRPYDLETSELYDHV
jgi:uncharacterized protein YfcZ (UPF0381/DUF406 family)